MGPRAADYLWQCCHCHGPWISVANNEHCSDCHRRRCRGCEITVVRIKDTYKSKRLLIGKTQAQSKDVRRDPTWESPRIFPSVPNEVNDLVGNAQAQLEVKGRGPRWKSPGSFSSAPYEAVRPQVLEAHARSQNKRSDLRCEPPENFSAAPYEANDILVCQGLNTPPGSVRGPSTSPLLSPCVNPKHSVVRRSLAESPYVDIPIKSLDLDGSPAGNSPAPVPDISVSVDPDSKVSTPHSALSDHSLSHDVDTTASESPAPMGHPSWLDSLSHRPLYSTIVEVWGEFWSAGLVDQGDPSGNAQEPTPSSSSSTPGDGSGNQTSGGSNRKRESSNKDDSRDAKKAKTSDSGNYPEVSRSRLACHFYKMNPRQHWKCMRKHCDTIGHLKQHLRGADHKLGPTHCKNCWVEFPGEVELVQHACNPTRGKYVDQLQRIPRGPEPEQWYWIWDQLFPNVLRPASPYYTEDSTEDVYLQRFIDFAEARFPSLSNNIPEMRAAAQAWLSAPPHTLNARQLPTPATDISDDEVRTSPAAFQMVAHDVETSSNLQSSRLLADEAYEDIDSLLWFGTEDLPYLSPPPADNIEEESARLYAPSTLAGGIDIGNSADASTSYDSETNYISGMQEVMHTSAWNLAPAIPEGSSNAASHEHWGFCEETILEEVGMSAWNQRAPVVDSSHRPLLEEWVIAEGLTAAEHLREVVGTDCIDDFQSASWKGMDETMEHLGDTDDED